MCMRTGSGPFPHCFNPTRLSAGNEMDDCDGISRIRHVSIQPGCPPGMRCRCRRPPASPSRCFNPTRLSAGNEIAEVGLKPLQALQFQSNPAVRRE